MKVKITNRMMDEVLRGLKSSVTELGKTHAQIANTACGQLAVELANATNPPFIDQNKSQFVGFRYNIADQVEDAFPARAAWWARIVSTKGRAFANKWWRLQNEDEEKAMQLLRDHGIVIRHVDITSANHRATRTNRKGRVAKKWDGGYIYDGELGKRSQYTVRKQKNVGLAKAAWIAASEAAGAKTRVGGKAVGWLRSMSGRASGTGSIKADDKGFTIVLTNTMPYADEAENKAMMAAVKTRTMERVGNYLKTMVRAVAKKAQMTQQGA